MKVSKPKYNNIAVWDLTFYRLDDEGNPLTDKEGKVITYDVKITIVLILQKD